MILWISIFLLVLIAGGIYLYKSRTAATGYVPAGQFMQQHRAVPKAQTKPAVARADYRAVSIRCGDNPCRASLRLQGRRGLHSQIPRIPLSNCDAEVCTCRYEQHPDRRYMDDRRAVYGSLSSTSRPGQDDRRGKNDRRAAEDADLKSFRIRYR